MLIASLQYGVGWRLFLRGVYEFVTIDDFTSGIGKAVVFGLLTGAIASYEGLRARGGTEGVGHAATRTVVAIAFSVLVADFVLTKVLLTL
jgi:phospholipid/cholesterol/gamma-HCH transport system permease protein